MDRPLFAGYTLGSPALTRILDAQQVDNVRVDRELAADEAARIAERNDAIFTDAVRKWFRDTDAPRSRYVIRRKGDGLFYAGPTASGAGSVWVGSPERAHPFEFMTIALAALLFEIDEAPELFDVVPVEG